MLGSCERWMIANCTRCQLVIRDISQQEQMLGGAVADRSLLEDRKNILLKHSMIKSNL